MLSLGILDPCLVGPRRPPRLALLETIDLAERAEAWGYARFWLSEHHERDVAHSAPETLTAIVAGHTSALRVGPAGVLLSHACPLRLAKSFRLLEALYPGRIDLGVGAGRAPPAVAAAFGVTPPSSAEAYGARVAAMQMHLEDRDLPPAQVPAPELWVLGSGGPGSCAIAAQRGARFAVTTFFGDRGASGAVATYRRDFQPSLSLPEPRWIVAVAGVCADTEEAAERIRREHDPGGLVPTVVGASDHCQEALHRVARAFGTEEVVFVDICRRQEDRLRCYELLAKGANLSSSRASEAGGRDDNGSRRAVGRS